MSDTDTDDDWTQQTSKISPRRRLSAFDEPLEEDEQTTLGKIHHSIGNHGEVHIIVAEIDEEVEARLGTTTFNYEARILKVEAPNIGREITFSEDHIVSWYEPTTVFHE